MISKIESSQAARVRFALCGVIALGSAVLGGAVHAAPAPQAETSNRASPELTVAAPKKNLGPACKAADRYLSLLLDGPRTEMADIFSDNVAHYGINGTTFRSKAETVAFYNSPALFKTGVQSARIVSFLESGHDCVIEIAVAPSDQSAPFVLMSMQRFTVDEAGKINRHVAYLSPPASLPPPKKPE